MTFWPPRMTPRMERVLKENVGQKKSGRWAPRMYRIWVMGPLAVLVALAAGWTVFVLLGKLSGFHMSWWGWHDFGKVAPSQRTDLVRDAATIVALLGAVLAGVYAYRKQRLDEAASHRADAESLSQRYQDAADQLGHANAAVRLAGVYAMGRLADAWPEQRQTCVDVLCAYVRTTWPGISPDMADAIRDEGVVRQAVLAVIGQHVHMDATVSWSDKTFDLRHAVLPRIEWSDVIFENRLPLRGARFTEDCFVERGTFHRGIDLIQVQVSGKCSWVGVNLPLGPTVMNGMTIAESESLQFQTAYIAPEAEVTMHSVHVDGEFSLDLKPADSKQGKCRVSGLVLGEQGQVDVDDENDFPHEKLERTNKVELRLRNWTASDVNRVSLPDGHDITQVVRKHGGPR